MGAQEFLCTPIGAQISEEMLLANIRICAGMAAIWPMVQGMEASFPGEIDWIVVGGGAAGCTAATALADAGENVLVIERGPSDIDIPTTQSGKTWSEVVVDATEQ